MIPGAAVKTSVAGGSAVGVRASAKWLVSAGILLLLVVVSSFGVIFSAHKSRELFGELERVRRAQNEIQVEWRQLLLERSTMSSHARVEAMARDELQMQPIPDRVDVLVVP